MAMRPIFRGFCINRFGIGPLHYISSPSNFDFEFVEIFVIEKWLPDLASRRIGYWMFKRQLPSSASRGVAKVSWGVTIQNFLNLSYITKL